MALALILVVPAVIFLLVQFGSVILPPVKGLPVLMYHKVSDGANDHLTLSVQRLERQFRYLSEHGYTCLQLGQLIENKALKLPPRSVLLTFDDAYLNNLQYLYPLLQKYGFHATIMLPVGFIGKTNAWDKTNELLMNYDHLHAMDRRYVSFGLHTYGHIPFKTTPFADIAADIEKCRQELHLHGIDYLPALAYPYGSYPREKGKKEEFFALLNQSGISWGLRIGNRINNWPLKSRYEIKRIDIKGSDPFWIFKTKLKKGFVKRF